MQEIGWKGSDPAACVPPLARALPWLLPLAMDGGGGSGGDHHCCQEWAVLTESLFQPLEYTVINLAGPPGPQASPSPCTETQGLSQV